MKVGIIGTGWIAEKAAITLNGLTECEAYAVGSRSQVTADAFARKWNIPKAYGSYAQLMSDPDVDLVYIGTPHSHHYDVTKEAILAGKPCLVEKAFMANVRQTREIIELAHEHRVFLAEAIWTRYQPAVGIVRRLIADGRIGEPRLITARCPARPWRLCTQLRSYVHRQRYTEHRWLLCQVRHRYGPHQHHHYDTQRRHRSQRTVQRFVCG